VSGGSGCIRVGLPGWFTPIYETSPNPWLDYGSPQRGGH
jgi:hypothetical protein